MDTIQKHTVPPMLLREVEEGAQEGTDGVDSVLYSDVAENEVSTSIDIA